MKLFVLSGACRTRAHCQTCRDLEGGRTWRTGLEKFYTMPSGGIDFPCPHNVEWGFKSMSRPPLPVIELTDEEVEEERRRLKAGGCCGSPSKE
jgi:hypothetical protein